MSPPVILFNTKKQGDQKQIDIKKKVSFSFLIALGFGFFVLFISLQFTKSGYCSYNLVIELKYIYLTLIKIRFKVWNP